MRTYARSLIRQQCGSGLISQSETSASTSGFHTRYYAYDGHGNTRELTDATGAVTDRYDYDAFGILVFRQGTTTNAYLYCGEQFDGDLGLYYLRARYLNPDSGRFWTMDSYEGTTGDPASLHKYLYANADPVRFSDPSGHLAGFDLTSLQATTFVVGTASRMAIPRVARYALLAAAGTVLALTAGDSMPGITAQEVRRNGSAIIGETTVRVRYTKQYDLPEAEIFAWDSSIDQYLTNDLAGGDAAEKERILEEANFKWISSVMARRMRIYDIGFDEDRVAGRPTPIPGVVWRVDNEIGKYYMLESEWTRGYPLKVIYPAPGSLFCATKVAP